jgi:hypothetical protein
MSVERRVTLAAAAAALASALLAPSVEAHARAPMWSLGAVLSRIDGARITVGSWSARVQTTSTLCNGEGSGKRWLGMRHWRHFTCTWTVFDRKGGVDRDVTFRVHTLTARRYLIEASRFGPD